MKGLVAPDIALDLALGPDLGQDPALALTRNPPQGRGQGRDHQSHQGQKEGRLQVRCRPALDPDLGPIRIHTGLRYRLILIQILFPVQNHLTLLTYVTCHLNSFTETISVQRQLQRQLQLQ